MLQIPRVVEDLIPKFPPKSIVVLDIATFQKEEEMINAFELPGHTVLYLPPSLI